MAPVSADRLKLVEKITKLMALADNTSFSEEADSARTMAIDLMAKHNIDMADMSVAKEDFMLDIEDSNRTRPATEEITLINAVAIFCGVAMLISKDNTSVKYKFIGTPSAIEFFKYTRDTILNQRQHAWQTSGKRGSNVMYHWKMGYALGASAKLMSLMKATESKIQSYGLVPIKEHEQAMDWFKQDHKVTAGRRSTLQGKYDRDGYAKGNQVGINKGVASNKLQIGR